MLARTSQGLSDDRADGTEAHEADLELVLDLRRRSASLWAFRKDISRMWLLTASLRPRLRLSASGRAWISL